MERKLTLQLLFPDSRNPSEDWAVSTAQLRAGLQPLAYEKVQGFTFAGCTLRCSTGPLDRWTNPHETLRLTPLENLVPNVLNVEHIIQENSYVAADVMPSILLLRRILVCPAWL